MLTSDHKKIKKTQIQIQIQKQKNDRKIYFNNHGNNNDNNDKLQEYARKVERNEIKLKTNTAETNGKRDYR